ncbi:MAG: galactokinase [Proteobacteria bacterium]|nr:galactokinase [Pseudomonadota bacterium]
MNMPARFSEALNDFSAGTAGGAVLVKVPARVNIIGEHSDYNNGFVLPMSTAIFTWATASPRDDRKIEVTSHNIGETCLFELDGIQPGQPFSWVEYVKGVAAELEGFGIVLRGADILIESDIPLGAGLSSSASLELAVAKTLLAVVGESVAGPELAKLCQKAEQNYAGVRCGIMDQYTLNCAEEGHAILLDCRSLEVFQIPMPPEFGFILTDCGVKHRLPDGRFNSRADECEAAVEILARNAPDIESLRDLRTDVLEVNRTALGDVLYRRCRHVVSENERVKSAVQAIEDGELQKLGALFDACHTSLRDDYEVSCDELEALVKAANASNGVFGARMVGAGFGGCVLSVCRSDRVSEVATEIRANYATVTGQEPWQHIVEPAKPARVITQS